MITWALTRLVFAALPLAIGGSFGSIPPSPVGIVFLAGLVGLIDVYVRGERILWANLAVRPWLLFGIYSATAIPAELLLSLVPW